MSFGHLEEEDEVRSAAASSYDGHELNSNSSDASLSQSDISLCDDGGSEEEEGEGDGILGHLEAAMASEDSHFGKDDEDDSL